VSDAKIEAFLSTPAKPNDNTLSELLTEIRHEFGERVEIAIYQGHNELYDDYNITATPAVVVGELVKIMGFCPSKETLVSALREAGLELTKRRQI
jgi:hypothetical protein